jgi:chromosome segregation ATPase
MQIYLYASAPTPAQQESTQLAELLVTATPPPQPLAGQPEVKTMADIVLTQTPAAVTPVVSKSVIIMPEGITTKPEDHRGNWYDKRQILSQARTMYEQIRERIAKIESQQPGFLAKQRALDKEVGALFLSLGFEQGELDERYTELMNELNKERTSQGQLTEEERKLLAQVEDKKKLLQALKEEVAALQEFTGAVDKAVATVIEQIEVSRSYEQKAWEDYDKIDNVLNEKVAQQLLNEMQSFAEHIAAIDSYMRGKLTQYVDQTIDSVRTGMQKIKSHVDDLKKLGIILSRQLAEQEKEAEEARKRAEEIRKQHEASQKIPPPASSWLATITDTFYKAWNFMVGRAKQMVSSVSSLFSK